MMQVKFRKPTPFQLDSTTLESALEHGYLHENGRVEYTSVTDEQALAGVQLLARTEGILPALESAHAIHFAGELAARMSKEEIVVICLSGRGDKDVVTVRDALGGGIND
jgi:tryptophan synthase beta chain